MGGSYAVLNSEDDDYEVIECDHCHNEVKGNTDTYSCDECNDNTICEDCIIKDLDNVSVCKQCVDRAYPRKADYIEKIVEKPIEVEKKVYVDKEGMPIDVSFNPFKKSKFD